MAVKKRGGKLLPVVQQDPLAQRETGSAAKWLIVCRENRGSQLTAPMVDSHTPKHLLHLDFSLLLSLHLSLHRGLFIAPPFINPRLRQEPLRSGERFNRPPSGTRECCACLFLSLCRRHCADVSADPLDFKVLLKRDDLL